MTSSFLLFVFCSPSRLFCGVVSGFYLSTNVKFAPSLLLIFFAEQPSIGIGDSDGQLGCHFPEGFAVLGGDIVSNLCTAGFVAHE